jgi:hypothetical protein
MWRIVGSKLHYGAAPKEVYLMRVQTLLPFGLLFLGCGGAVDMHPGVVDAADTEALQREHHPKPSGCDVIAAKPELDVRQLCANQQAIITAKVQSNQEFTGLVYTTVTNTLGEVIFERFYIETFAPEKTVSVTSAFLASATQEPGQYEVSTRVLDESFEEIARSPTSSFEVRTAQQCEAKPEEPTKPCKRKRGKTRKDHDRDFPRS